MKKILIVEDDPDLGVMVRDILDISGYHVVLLPRADRVIEILNGSDFDLCILDVMIAGVDGRDLCRDIRGASRFRDLPVLMMSALNGIGSQCIAIGADDFISKPFEIDIFLKKVRSLSGG